MLPGHHGSNAQQHIDENNNENVSGSTATTSWVVQASEHTAYAGQQPQAPLLDVVRDTPVAESTLHQPPRAPLALGVVPVGQRYAGHRGGWESGGKHAPCGIFLLGRKAVTGTAIRETVCRPF